MKKGLSSTSRTGPSSSLLNGSSAGLPILNVPPGIAIILNDTEEFGISSVKDLNSTTFAGSVYISLGAEDAAPNVLLLP